MVGGGSVLAEARRRDPPRGGHRQPPKVQELLVRGALPVAPGHGCHDFSPRGFRQGKSYS